LWVFSFLARFPAGTQRSFTPMPANFLWTPPPCSRLGLSPGPAMLVRRSTILLLSGNPPLCKPSVSPRGLSLSPLGKSLIPDESVVVGSVLALSAPSPFSREELHFLVLLTSPVSPLFSYLSCAPVASLLVSGARAAGAHPSSSIAPQGVFPAGGIVPLFPVAFSFTTRSPIGLRSVVFPPSGTFDFCSPLFPSCSVFFCCRPQFSFSFSRLVAFLAPV